MYIGKAKYIYIFILICILVLSGIVTYIFFHKSNFNNMKEQQNNISTEYNKRVKLLEKSVNVKSIEPEKEIIFTNDFTVSKITLLDRYNELYQLYYAGISEKYLPDGKKIDGIEPDPEKAILYLNLMIQVCKESQRTISENELLLKLAKLHKNGMTKYDGSIEKASNIYNYLLMQNITKDMYEEIITDKKDIANKWLNLKSIKINDNMNEPNIQTNIKQTDNIYTNYTDYTVDPFDFEDLREIDHMFNTVEIPVIEVIPEIMLNYNDPQNVHDSQVVSTLRNSIRILKTDNPEKKDKHILNSEIDDYIKSLTLTDKTRDAYKALEHIKKLDVMNVSLGINEIDALNIVWSRIKNEHGSNKDLLEIFSNELSSMIEHGNVVCSSGRISRIFDTLNGFDKDVHITSSNMINEEMLSSASKIRSTYLEKYSENDRNLIERGTHAQQESIDNIVRNNIKDTLRKDYVDTDIIKNTKFESILSEWINEI